MTNSRRQLTPPTLSSRRSRGRDRNVVYGDVNQEYLQSQSGFYRKIFSIFASYPLAVYLTKLQLHENHDLRSTLFTWLPEIVKKSLWINIRSNS